MREVPQVGARIRYARQSTFDSRMYGSAFARITKVEVEEEGTYRQRCWVTARDEEDGLEVRSDSYYVKVVPDHGVVRVGWVRVEGKVISTKIKRTKIRGATLSRGRWRASVWEDRLNVLLALDDGTRLFGVAPRKVLVGDTLIGVADVDGAPNDIAFGFIARWDRRQGVRLIRNGVEVE